MEGSKFSSALIFVIGNYFVTFFVIGLIAAGISLFNKPKPLRSGEAGEAFFSYYLLFAIGINNLINFVFHVFLGDIAAKFIGWENSPFQAEVGFASLGVGRSDRIQGELAVPLCYADSAFGFLIGRSWRSHLSDDCGAQFLGGKCGTGSSN